MSAFAKAGGSSPADLLLGRLDTVRETSPGQYVARCPAHDDKTPSLAVRDNGDRLLVFCHAGCETGDVMDAVGLSLADLFAGDDHNSDHRVRPIRERWNAPAMLRELSDESVVVLIAATDLLQNRPLPPDDYKRLRVAVDRIARIVEVTS